jgi:hypothetical protein
MSFIKVKITKLRFQSILMHFDLATMIVLYFIVLLMFPILFSVALVPIIDLLFSHKMTISKQEIKLPVNISLWNCFLKWSSKLWRNLVRNKMQMVADFIQIISKIN